MRSNSAAAAFVPVGLGQDLLVAGGAQAARALQHVEGLDRPRKAREDVHLQQDLAPGPVGLALGGLGAQAEERLPAPQDGQDEEPRQPALASGGAHAGGV